MSTPFVSRDQYNQNHTQHINGHRIQLVRLPEKDTIYHAYYGYTLTTKDGRILFGKLGDTCGIPTGYGPTRPSHEATLLAFKAVTMQEGDTGEDYFDSYTPEELAWRDSLACEQLGYEVSDREEAMFAHKYRN